MNPAVALARVLVDELVRCGLTHAALSPGSRSAPLALALHTDDRVDLRVRVDERSASFLALGMGKASGRPAVVTCTSGTATANLHPAVLEASQARVPLLVLTADRPPELRDTGANQTVDQIGLYGRAVRWFCEVGAPQARPGSVAAWRSVASRAWAEASGLLGGPPGPVHLNVAFREPLLAATDDPPFPESLDGRPGGAPWTAVPAAVRTPSAADLDELAARVEGTERGLVVLGDGVPDPRPLVALAQAAAWPVVAEPTSNGRTGERSISTAALLLGDPTFLASHRPDLVLVAGKPGLSRSLLGLLAGGVEQVRADPYGGWLDPTRSASRLLAALPEGFAVAPRDGSAWLRRWCDAEAAARAALDGILDESDEPTEPRTARDLAAALPDGSALLAGSSMPIRDLDLTMRPRRGLRILGNRGASGIDGLVSTASGIAVAHDGPAAALLGDLSLLHDQNGLRAPGEASPDLVLVVVDNDGGGIFSLLPQSGVAGFERVFGTPHGSDLALVARAAGCGHRRVKRASQLAGHVAAAMTDGGLQVVEVRTDRNANAALHARLRREVPAAALA